MLSKIWIKASLCLPLQLTNTSVAIGVQGEAGGAPTPIAPLGIRASCLATHKVIAAAQVSSTQTFIIVCKMGKKIFFLALFPANANKRADLRYSSKDRKGKTYPDT